MNIITLDFAVIEKTDYIEIKTGWIANSYGDFPLLTTAYRRKNISAYWGFFSRYSSDLFPMGVIIEHESNVEKIKQQREDGKTLSAFMRTMLDLLLLIVPLLGQRL